MAIRVSKTVSTGVLHLVVAVAVGYAVTGSATVGGVVAVAEAVANIVAHHYHEKAWAVVEGWWHARRAASLA